MLSVAALAGPWPRLGLVVAAALAASAMLARTDRLRAWSMLGALALAPVLLLDDVWHSAQLHFIHADPLYAAIGGCVVLVVLGAAAYGVHRAPWVVAPLAALTLPFRIPISTPGSGAAATTNNLLVPLYFVIAASALAWLVPVLWQDRTRAGRMRTRGEPRPPALLVERLMAVFIVVYALQGLYSPTSAAKSGFVLALQNEVFFYLPFAVLLARLRDLQWDRTLLLRCLGVTVGLAVAFCLIGFVEETTRHLYFRSNLIFSNEVHEYFTINSVFYDPNIFGRYLALVMLLVATVLLYDRRMKVQLGSLLTLAILWTCLLFTLSRSSLVALGLGLAVLAAFRWRSRPVVYLGVLVALLGGAWIGVHLARHGLQWINNNSSGRGSLVSNGLHLFADRPLLGFGSGSFSLEYASHFPQAAASVSDSHNIAVTVAAEQGLLGELIYVALVLTALVTLFRGARESPYRIAIAAAFTALLLHTMLYADFLEDPETWVLLAIGGSLAVAARSAALPERRDRHLRAVA